MKTVHLGRAMVNTGRLGQEGLVLHQDYNTGRLGQEGLVLHQDYKDRDQSHTNVITNYYLVYF